MRQRTTEESIPNPEFLIKSIAEQGYSLESALADLIDNSISANANKIEILTDKNIENLRLFLSDNGEGMDERELKKNMKFPSNFMEDERDYKDLGRFGLGMKTASFSQTRCFTVISRHINTTKYSGRTWDVNQLKSGKWEIIINSEEEINEILNSYRELQSSLIGGFKNYHPNTIIYWDGMYKFDRYLQVEHKQEALNKQLNETTREYLGIVFHRFMERNKLPLEIKLNNLLVQPFNPFPANSGIRSLGIEQYAMQNDVLSMEGFVLPSEAIKSDTNVFFTQNKGLMDLEGMFVYRADRIILFGGWNGIIKKRPNIQLARLKIEVGNASDQLLQLNVAKSNVVIPFELKTGFLRYVIRLTEEARKEYFSREITHKKTTKNKKLDLLSRVGTSKGNKVKFNIEYPALKELLKVIPADKTYLFKTFLRIIETRINKIRYVHENEDFISLVENKSFTTKEIESSVIQLKKIGFNSAEILNIIEKDMGINRSTLPESILLKLN